MSQNLRRASLGTCGCLQVAANRTLNAADQKRGARMFGNPERVQAMKLSDSRENERFWGVWAAFADTAEKMCSTS
ncbi:MAG: hypothetical protein ABJC87_18335 [Roseobacter sp.]